MQMLNDGVYFEILGGHRNPFFLLLSEKGMNFCISFILSIGRVLKNNGVNSR
jgi:hypothetical protein